VDLTEDNKKHIDSMSFFGLLEGWRNAPVGSPWFQGETGKYWGDRMAELRNQNNAQAVSDSKNIGW
jgi:hypothetical protein